MATFYACDSERKLHFVRTRRNGSCVSAHFGIVGYTHSDVCLSESAIHERIRRLEKSNRDAAEERKALRAISAEREIQFYREELRRIAARSSVMYVIAAIVAVALWAAFRHA